MLTRSITFSLLIWSHTLLANQLTVVTYNVWFDHATARERIPKLLDIVAHQKADIIAFQEVESWFLAFLKTDKRFKPYHLSVERGWFNSIKGGLLLLTKNKIYQKSYSDLPSNMSRGLLKIETDINGNSLCIATVHLESMLEDTQLRLKQLNIITKKNKAM